MKTQYNAAISHTNTINISIAKSLADLFVEGSMSLKASFGNDSVTFRLEVGLGASGRPVHLSKEERPIPMLGVRAGRYATYATNGIIPKNHRFTLWSSSLILFEQVGQMVFEATLRYTDMKAPFFRGASGKQLEQAYLRHLAKTSPAKIASVPKVTEAAHEAPTQVTRGPETVDMTLMQAVRLINARKAELGDALVMTVENDKLRLLVEYV